MTRFFLQDIDSEQGWALRQSATYYKEFLKSEDELLLNDYSTGAGEIPVGTLDFVHAYMRNAGIPVPKPMNVPLDLWNMAGTRVEIVEGPKDGLVGRFVKSADVVKHPHNGVHTTIPEGRWQLTDELDIESEYRVFVWNKRIVGMRHYAGSPFLVPSEQYVKRCVNAFVGAPIAYTLDIGILGTGSCMVIECHSFYSCGLYGFSDWQVYPLMLSGWFKEHLRKSKLSAADNRGSGVGQ